MSAEADVKLEDFNNIFRLDGKVAVVTGGSRGLGLQSSSGFVSSIPPSITFNLARWYKTSAWILLISMPLWLTYVSLYRQTPPGWLLESLYNFQKSQRM